MKRRLTVRGPRRCVTPLSFSIPTGLCSWLQEKHGDVVVPQPGQTMAAAPSSRLVRALRDAFAWMLLEALLWVLLPSRRLVCFRQGSGMLSIVLSCPSSSKCQSIEKKVSETNAIRLAARVSLSLTSHWRFSSRGCWGSAA